MLCLRLCQGIARKMRLLSIAIAIIMLLIGVGLSSRLAIAASVSDGGIASSSHRAAGVWVGDTAIAEVRLVSAVNATGSLRELPLGLEFRMARGWKIYWRTPVRLGLPRKLIWLLSMEPC